MTERTPKPSTVRGIWARAHPFSASTEIDERYAEFDRMIAEVEKAAAAKALREAAKSILKSTEVLDEEHPIEKAYITCTRLDSRALERYAGRVEDNEEDPYRD